VATPFSDADADVDSPTARDNFQLMAVPKKMPSHARRRIRQHGQRLLEERKNPIVKCARKELKPLYFSFSLLCLIFIRSITRQFRLLIYCALVCVFADFHAAGSHALAAACRCGRTLCA
jgi:hypothetical protein